jgi:hypothetical protein
VQLLLFIEVAVTIDGMQQMQSVSKNDKIGQWTCLELERGNRNDRAIGAMLSSSCKISNPTDPRASTSEQRVGQAFDRGWNDAAS